MINMKNHINVLCYSYSYSAYYLCLIDEYSLNCETTHNALGLGLNRKCCFGSLMCCAVRIVLNPGFSQKLLQRQLLLKNTDTEETCYDFQASSGSVSLLQTLTMSFV